MFGFLNCNKPAGFSSRDLVNVIQRRLRGKKVKLGHCGTLDPLADGVLVVAVGPASRLVPFVHETSKQYHGSFRLAAESPTGDVEFEPTLFEDHPIPSLEQIESACREFTGSIEQIPPAYSAIKIDGRRAYDLAREGQQVEVPPRTVTIHSLSVIRYAYPDFELSITCSTGTYIRTLGIDIAKSLGTTAVMTNLCRTRVGEFKLAQSHHIDMIREQPLEEMLLPAITGVTHLPKMIVDAEQCQRLINGLSLEDRQHQLPTDPIPKHAAAVRADGILQAIIAPKRGTWTPKRVFKT
ncbi:tRNA pseudouridine(55) synthase TruB [Rhodopirellula sp. MGV]|uniref:tRNA pseudouridine(55) synthase TruB n=1 Tax=Rhodopirellula sp. MGV TaxID=2023130 RepID=UPI000B96F31B|nr:tRNA pseudouridine(55) synthase TruB [Rhodopirellula sp. MGV]OYP37270.1 tRNA pseudouridine(55) synthase TruB [Rhodopirellula sp. MGV]PNY38057.1 tRNA pseudouridine(55) synthase TruB [Rhodopirellula baltica]